VSEKRRKFYPRKFQQLAVEHMRTCVSVNELAKELGVTRRRVAQVNSGFAGAPCSVCERGEFHRFL